MVEFQVYSYNVLSSSLAGEGYFVYCDPVHLKAKTRLARLKDKLGPLLEENAIICLQEVGSR